MSLLQARSTETDAGTEITSEAELSRLSIESVVPAATQRITQALRQLEEYSKVVSLEESARFKQLRYEAYDWLARIELRLRAESHIADTKRLYLLMDCSKPLDQFSAYVAALAEAGVDFFQLRDKSAEAAKLMEYACTAKAALASSGSRLIINDRVDVALACHAGGVHLGQEDMSLNDARRLVGHTMLIGISTHSIQQALEAEQGGADYIGCGPTFPSTTKTFERFKGTEFLEQIASHISLPYFAIGGIDTSNIPQVMATGCRRVAVSGVVHSAREPVQIVQQLRQALG